MSKKESGLALLPNGFADVLPPRAEGEAQSIDLLMKTFRGFGYQRIKPPLLEFEDSLLAPGVGERLAGETFRLMDPVSHRMLGVRSDITPQIARIASSRLEHAPRPLRLTYANDVLRIRGTQMRTERQFTQTGCEIVGGTDSAQTDAEICVLAILGLKALGLTDITLDLTIPNFVTRILSRGALDEVQRETLEKAVERRDYDALVRDGGKESEKMAAALHASGAHKGALEKLQSIALDEDIAQDVVRLIALCGLLEDALDDLGISDVKISIDVLEQAGFEYHKGLGFTLFCAGVHGELGRGGCYDVRFGCDEASESAKGFTLYMDTIGKIYVPVQSDKKILIDLDEKWNVLIDLQEQGWLTMRGASQEEALRNGCSHLYKDGKIVEIST